jgi:PPM family protein phosphatase
MTTSATPSTPTPPAQPPHRAAPEPARAQTAGASNNAIPVPVNGEETLPVIAPREEHGPFAVPAGMPEVDLCGLTDRGTVRERNEDQYVIADLQRAVWIRDASVPATQDARWSGGAQGMLLAVADGIGGHGGGDVASAVALDTVVQCAAYLLPWFSPGHSDGASAEQAVRDELVASADACESRLRRVADRKQIAQMAPGTTLTVAYVIWPDLYILHVGDSRCYLLRGGQLIPLTRDHTVAQQLADRGVMTPEAAAHSRFTHVLYNAIGGGHDGVAPDVRRVELTRGDRLLLCTDGVYGQVSEEAIREVLASGKSAADACRILIEEANRAGGRDNATAVVARF